MKYTPARVNRIAELLKDENNTINDVCKSVGISKETFFEWKRNKVDFSDLLKSIEDYRLESYKETVRNASRKGLLTLLEGREFDEVTTEYEGIKQPDGSTKPVIKTRRVTKRFIMPNPTAVIFAMKNTDKETFNELVRHEVEQNTTLNAVVDQTTTLIRKVTFKTRETTTKPQVLPNPQNN